MDYLALVDHWGALVHNFKDDERAYQIERYTTERMCRDILSFIRKTRIRQYNLFTQKRGEEFERMYKGVEALYGKEPLDRFLEDDTLWQITLELGNE